MSSLIQPEFFFSALSPAEQRIQQALEDTVKANLSWLWMTLTVKMKQINCCSRNSDC